MASSGTPGRITCAQKPTGTTTPGLSNPYPGTRGEKVARQASVSVDRTPVATPWSKVTMTKRALSFCRR